MNDTEIRTIYFALRIGKDNALVKHDVFDREEALEIVIENAITALRKASTTLK